MGVSKDATDDLLEDAELHQLETTQVFVANLGADLSLGVDVCRSVMDGSRNAYYIPQPFFLQYNFQFQDLDFVDQFVYLGY